MKDYNKLELELVRLWVNTHGRNVVTWWSDLEFLTNHGIDVNKQDNRSPEELAARYH